MSVINSFNYIQKYPLLEKFGIYNLDDEQYQNDIKLITKTFLYVVNNQIKDISEINIDWFGYPYDGIYKVIEFNNLCNIKTIKLLIKDINPAIDTLNVALTNYDAKKHNLFEYTEYEETDKFNRIHKKYKIDTFTIVLAYHKSYIYSQNYRSIIEHELKHAFDLQNIYHVTSELMNKDIIAAESILYNYIENAIENSQLNDSDFNIKYTKLIDINKNYKTEYYNDPYIIFPLLSDMLYYMNKSEISARLVQFKYQDDIAETSGLYKEYDKLCENIMKYSSDIVKKLINAIILQCDYSNIYNIKFKDSSNAYIANTNKLFKFYKKRITYFLKTCDKLLTIIKPTKISNYLPFRIPQWVKELN